MNSADLTIGEMDLTGKVILLLDALRTRSKVNEYGILYQDLVPETRILTEHKDFVELYDFLIQHGACVQLAVTANDARHCCSSRPMIC